MTNEEIDNLEAGRALDALVAERVMGFIWRVSKVSGRRCLISPDYCPAWFVDVANGSEPLADQWDTRLPNYSTDIAAAWQVVEKLRSFSLSRHLDGSWHCWHWNKGHLNANAATPALAICLAALKARAESPPLEARIAKACDKVLDGLEETR